MTRTRAIEQCICCGRTGPIIGRRLIRACYAKHRRNGTLHVFPQDHAAQQRARSKAGLAGGTVRSQLSQALIEDYAFLRSMGETHLFARLRVGVSETTARKYERHLKETAGEMPSRDPNAEPASARRTRVRAMVLDHLHAWPASLFSINALVQIVAPRLERHPWSVWRDVRRVIDGLMQEALVEEVAPARGRSRDGLRANRYRLSRLPSEVKACS